MSNLFREARAEAEAAIHGAIVLDRRPAPFAALKVPEYVVGEESSESRWRLRKLDAKRMPRFVRGYFVGMQPTPNLDAFWVLEEAGRRSGVWMSVAPMELESQAQAVALAEGSVLVAGLGMGVVTYNLLLKPEVTRVLVIEREQQVIDLMMPSLVRWVRESKGAVLNVVRGDIFDQPRVTETFDAAIVDIWPSLGDTAIRPDMLKIAKRWSAKRWAAWGLEIDFVDWVREHSGMSVDEAIQQRDLFRQYVRGALPGLSVLGEEDDRMVELSFRAAYNMCIDAASKEMG